jgi:CRP-like cAMP-binding protein
MDPTVEEFRRDSVLFRTSSAHRYRHTRCMQHRTRTGAGAKTVKTNAKTARAYEFSVQEFLDSTGITKPVMQYRRNETVFTQGDTCDHVWYIQSGGIKLSVLSKTGKEAVVAMLGPGDFFGEGCLAGQELRMGSATAVTPSTVLRINKVLMAQLLHKQHGMSDRFISHILTRNIRIEEDLIDQLFNSSEKRLARTLLLLARYGKQAQPTREVPQISQETLAEMVGTTRSRVNFFLNKFRKLGFIEYKHDLPIRINNSLLSVVLLD